MAKLTVTRASNQPMRTRGAKRIGTYTGYLKFSSITSTCPSSGVEHLFKGDTIDIHVNLISSPLTWATIVRWQASTTRLAGRFLFTSGVASPATSGCSATFTATGFI